MATVSEQIQEIYIGLLGRAADKAGLDYWTNEINTGVLTIEQLRANIVNEQPEYAAGLGSMTRAQVVNELYNRLFERAPETDGLEYWVNGDGKNVNVDQLVLALSNGAAASDRLVLDNKTDAAEYYTANITTYTADSATAAVDSVDSTTASVEASKTSTDNGGSVAGSTFTLTTGADSFTGTANDDTFNAAQVAAGDTFTVGDTLNGGDGNDTLKVTETSAITGVPTGATITNIETFDLISGGAITMDTSSVAGVTTLKAATTNAAQTLTAAATTDVQATASTSVDDAIAVTGGKDVTVTLTNAVDTGAGAVTVTNAAGAVTASVSGNYTDGANVTSTNTTVTGGTTVSVTNSAGITAAETTAATTDGTNFTATQGQVDVTGNASTTEVTVKQDAAVTEVDSTGTDGKIGVVAGAVNVLDANRASTTDAGTIATVTLENAGAAVVNSGALTTLNLAGTLTTVNAGTLGALTTAANSALALNLTGAVSTGAVTIDNDITTLNVAGNTTASTLASLVAGGVKTLNVSGDAKVTATANTLGALTDVVVTNTGGFALGGTAIAATTNFTGGDGDDSFVMSNAGEKAITLGAGNDTVTYGGATSTTAGKVGSVDFGTGDADKLIMTSAQAAAADGSSALNASFTNFEVLRLSDALAGGATIDIDGIGDVTTVELAAGGANATTSILDNLNNGSTVDILAPSTGVVVQVDAAVAGASDVLNVKLTNSTATVNAFGSVTAANVETINISTVDTGENANVAATIDTATLVATGAKTVNVSGNNGLTLTNTGNTAITAFDASGVVADSATTVDTAANLAVTFVSANTTTTDTVTITGGAGNDTLTGNAAKDTINGGAGDDIVKGAAGQDTITVGTGSDAILFDSFAGVSTDSGTASADSISGFTLASAITTATDLDSVAEWIASDQGGANASVLGIDMDQDGANTNQAIAVEADATAQAGQAVGVTYTVKDGILTLDGAGAAAVDTLGEWLTEAAAVAATNGDILAFEFGSDTYVFGQNGAQDLLITLTGVTGAAALAETTATTTGAANTIYYVDIA